CCLRGGEFLRGCEEPPHIRTINSILHEGNRTGSQLCTSLGVVWLSIALFALSSYPWVLGNCQRAQRGAGRYAELFIDVVQMTLHRAFAQIELPGHLLVRESLRN